MLVFVVWSAIALNAGAEHRAIPPVIIQTPKNMTVAPGSPFKLECKAEGAPAPKITITRLEEAEMDPVKSTGNGLDGELRPKEVIYMNEEVYALDEGWYRCVAANSQGVVFADAYLRIKDLCGDVTCTGGKTCVPDNEAATASCVCPECVDLTYDPMCGSDCVTHFNYCQLALKNCLHGTSYNRFLDSSFCPEFTPPEFVETPPKEIDVVEGKAFTLTCKAAPAGRSPGPQPIISWYLADYEFEAPSLYDENPTLYGPDYGQKLGDGETIELRATYDYEVFCVAHHCKDSGNKATDIVSHQVNVKTGPVECFNEWRGGPSCQVFGDPHIITFDDVVYEFEGHCEYVLAKDCDKWTIHGDFEACSTHGRGACLSSLVFNYNEEITIELQRGMVVKIDGKDVEIEGLQTLTTQTKEKIFIFIEGDWVVIKFNIGMDSHNELRWDGLMSAQILLGSNYPIVGGLCGNANNDTTDDFMMRRTTKVVSNTARFGDSWRVDSENLCSKSSDLPKWKWRREFADRKGEAISTCDKMFESPQLANCANGYSGLSQVDSKAYKDACVTDFMRSDFNVDEVSGLNMACVAASNYAVRCDNLGNKVHLWREQTGCAGKEEELIEYKQFIRKFKSKSEF